MSTVAIPFLPKNQLMEYLQTQCHVDPDGTSGPFRAALDSDISHIANNASVEAVCITDVKIFAETVVVSYDVHYRIFDGCKGVDLRSFVDRKVTGIGTPNGWEFLKFEMTPDRSTVDEL